MESPEIIQEIPPLVLKSLGDRSYDKRKKAAFEIESIVHQMHVEWQEGIFNSRKQAIMSEFER